MAHEISLWRDVIAFIRLVCLLRKIKPDIVHAHSSKAGALARTACAVLRVPCVYAPHAFSFLDTTLSKRRRAFYFWVEKILARLTSALVAVSQEEARIAREKLGLPESRVFHIPNGIRLPTTDDRLSTSDVGSRKSEVIAFIGRDAPQKGLDIFLRAAALLKKDFPNLQVITVTDAPDETVAWQAAGLATIIVLPSRWEGLPYTLLDAMARGKAVVATRVGGIADVLRDGENGLLVEPENPAAVAEACARLLREPALRARLGEQARWDARGYGLQKMRQEYENLYDQPKGA